MCHGVPPVPGQQALGLVREVAVHFRVKKAHAEEIIGEVVAVVRGWQSEARAIGIPSGEQEQMASAFATAEA